MDGKRLRQILINIIGNAVKFTKKGMEKVNVQVVLNSEGKHECDLIFTISDTGVGIHKIDQNRIFHEFEQESGETNRRFGGSGLGLSIVTQLLELMGGTIHLQSEVGVGSTFTVIFVNVPVLDGDECNEVADDMSVENDLEWSTSSLNAAGLSAGDDTSSHSGRDLINLSEDSLDKLKDVFGVRFAQLSQGVNIKRINSLAKDLHSWSLTLNNAELIEFSAMFSDMVESMKIVEIIKIVAVIAPQF
jgi:hypothetical protein